MGVDVQRVPLLEMVVHHGGQEIVGGGHRVEIARQVQIEVLERDDLAVATAGRAPLMPKVGPMDAWRMAIVACLPTQARACPRPTVVVVLPSPSGVV